MGKLRGWGWYGSQTICIEKRTQLLPCVCFWWIWIYFCHIEFISTTNAVGLIFFRVTFLSWGTWVHTQTHIQIDIYMLVYARCRVVEPFNLDAIGIFEVWCQYCYFVGLHLTNKLHDFDKTSDTCSLSLAGLVEKWDFIFFVFMRCKWYIQFSYLFSMPLPNGAGHISLT